MGNKNNLWNSINNEGNRKKSITIVSSKGSKNDISDEDGAVKVLIKENKVVYNNFEEVLEALGGFGKFQLISVVLLLALEIPTAFVAFINVFIAAPPKAWTCVDITGDNETSVVALSGESVCSCNGSIASYSEASIISEWMLVCDAAWVSDFIQSIQMVGMLVGNFYGGSISDWYGRKYSVIGSIALMIFSQGVSAVANNPYVYATARFIGGAGFSGCLSIGAVYLMEFHTPEWRQLGSSVGPWGEGIMLLALLAYLIEPWRELMWISIIPFPIIMLLIIPVLPESPRWLLRNNRVKEAHEATKTIARLNGKSEDTISEEALQLISDKERNIVYAVGGSFSLEEKQSTNPKELKLKAKEERSTYMSLWRDVELRMTTFYLAIIWLSWAITYFGISYNIKNMEGNPYWNVVCLGLTDAIGYPASFHINNRIGRRKAVAFFMTWATFFLVTLAFLEIFIGVTKGHSWLLLSLCMVGKFGVSGVRGSARTLTIESYPTSVRSMGTGLAGVAASVGGIIAPQLAFLGSFWPSLPYFIFAIISIAGAVVSFLLNETMGKPMKEGDDFKAKVDKLTKTEAKEAEQLISNPTIDDTTSSATTKL